MASISLGISDEEVRKLRSVLDPSQVDKAIYQATKRTTERGRKMAGDVVRKRLTIRNKFIDAPNSDVAAIRSRFVGGAQASGTIEIKRRKLPLSEFDHTDSKTVGVSIRIDATRPALVLRHAFKARVASAAQTSQGVSHVGIFTRKKITAAVDQWASRNSPALHQVARDYLNNLSPNQMSSSLRSASRGQVTPRGYAWRFPIQEEKGPTVFDLVSEEEVLRPLLNNLGREYTKQLNNQLSRFTGGRLISLDAIAVDPVDREE